MYLVMAYNYPYFYASTMERAEAEAKAFNEGECQGCDSEQEKCIKECENHCHIVSLVPDTEVEV